MRYQVLGPLEATGGDGIVALGGPKQRLVLAVLLIRLERVVSDDRLVDELWPEQAPDGARHAIQTYVSELRRALDDEIERAGTGYRLRADPAVVDAHRFETLVEAARARTRDAPASAAALFREALGLWHGDPYGGVADAPLLSAEIHRLNELRIAVVEDRVAADLDAGRHAQLASELEALTREYPFRERLHALRMLALYRCDRQADALRAYHHARRWLDEEMGLDPSVELQELERRILNQDPALQPAPPAATRVAMPATAPGGNGPAVLRGFELRERLGQGRLGTTYRAYQPSIGREVAVTIFGDALRRDPGFARSFEASARRVSELDHPNVLPLLDWWREADEACVVTPWMRGGSLEASLARGPWSVSATLRLAEQVGGALVAAHRRELTHGNLTGRNVLLDSDGNALISDFPLLSHPLPGDGEPPSARSDIRALAVLLISALNGRPPDDDNPVLSLARQRSDLPADLVAVLAQASSAVSTDRHERVDDLLRDLRRAVGADVVAPAPGDQMPDRVRNPYKGLQAFHETDAPDFFGRRALVERLIEAVHAHPLVVVAGPSGSGKSSLVRAGLLPALRTRPPDAAALWQVAELFPGAFPFEELERALLRAGLARPADLYGELVVGEHGLVSAAGRLLPDGTNLLLIVDQLEEVWSLTEAIDVRRRFLASLVAAASDPAGRLRIVATLRADFLDRAMETHDFGELTRQGLVLVTAPSRAELAEAVAMPAQQVGLQFEPGLVERIVRDVDDEPGALPLLQHAMSELVSSREGHRLTVAGYEATGGVTGALGRRAESVHGELPPAAQAVARQVFLRLVAVDELRDDARRRVRRTELGALSPDARRIDEVLRRFGAHRLITFDRDPVTRGPTVEVAHEALFSEWRQLRAWIDARRSELLLHRRLRLATQEWLGANRSPDYLLGGTRLKKAETWSTATDLVLSPEERELLAASRDRETRARASRRQRRRITLAGMAGVAVLALVLSAFALLQAGRAEAGERQARARALAAASTTQLAHDQDVSLLLALDAVAATTRAGDPPLREALDALHAATIAHRTRAAVDGGLFVGFSGPRMAVSLGEPLDQPMTWDPIGGETLGTLDAPDAPWGDALVSPSGRLAASTFEGDRLWVWDVAGGAVVARLGRPGDLLVRPAISLDDRLLAAVAPQEAGRHNARVFDVASGTRVAEFQIEGWRRLAFGADGAWLAVTDQTSPVARLHDPRTGALIGTIGRPDAGSYLWNMAADATGKRLALDFDGNTRIEIWDVASRTLVRSIPVAAHPGTLCFLADGTRIAAHGSDELLHVWDIESGAEVITLPGPAIPGGGLACSQQGALVAVGSNTEITTVYDLRPESTTERATFAVPDPMAGAWLADGSLLVGGADGTLRHLDASGSELAAVPAMIASSPGWLPVSGDGRLVAAATGTEELPLGRIALLDPMTLRPVRTLEGTGHVPLAFSPDGSVLLAGGDGGAVGALLYEVSSGRLLAELRSPIDGPVVAMSGAFLPDGRTVVIMGPGGHLEAWAFSVPDGAFVGTICATEPAGGVAPDPEGEHLYLSTLSGHTIDVLTLDGLTDAIAGSPASCATDRPNASDGHRLPSIAALSGGGVAFSPDGRWLASTTPWEGTLAVTDRLTGQALFEVSHPAEVRLLGFSADSRWLAIAYNDQRGSLDAIRVYAVGTDDLVALARDKVSRGLTRAECEAFPEASCPSR